MKNKSICICEDDVQICALIFAAIKNEYLNIHIFNDPDEAAEFINDYSKIDLAIIDLHYDIPQKSGIDVLTKCEKYSIKSIIITGDFIESVIEMKALENYSGKIIEKPFNLESFKRIIIDTIKS